jgi:hypothetical protein
VLRPSPTATLPHRPRADPPPLRRPARCRRQSLALSSPSLPSLAPACSRQGPRPTRPGLGRARTSPLPCSPASWPPPHPLMPATSPLRVSFLSSHCSRRRRFTTQSPPPIAAPGRPNLPSRGRPPSSRRRSLPGVDHLDQQHLVAPPFELLLSQCRQHPLPGPAQAPARLDPPTAHPFIAFVGSVAAAAFPAGSPLPRPSRLDPPSLWPDRVFLAGSVAAVAFPAGSVVPLLFCRGRGHHDRRRRVRCCRPPWRGLLRPG